MECLLLSPSLDKCQCVTRHCLRPVLRSKGETDHGPPLRVVRPVTMYATKGEGRTGTTLNAVRSRSSCPTSPVTPTGPRVSGRVTPVGPRGRVGPTVTWSSSPTTGPTSRGSQDDRSTVTPVRTRCLGGGVTVVDTLGVLRVHSLGSSSSTTFPVLRPFLPDYPFLKDVVQNGGKYRKVSVLSLLE